MKFQTYSGRTLYSTKTPRFDYLGELGAKPAHELLEDLALPREWQPILAAHSRDAGIEFLSSPFDRAGGRRARRARCRRVQDRVVRARRHPAHRVRREQGSPAHPVDRDGVARRDRRRGRGRAPRRCARCVPAPVRVAVPVAAAHHEPPRDPDDGRRRSVCRSACRTTRSASTSRPPRSRWAPQLLEKHFTLDRTRSGPDHPFAIEPGELKELVAHVRDVEAALGDGVKRGPSDEERVEMYAQGAAVGGRRVPRSRPARASPATCSRSSARATASRRS